MTDESRADESLKKNLSIGSVARGWWKGLQPQTRADGRRSGEPGALARLRRGDLLDMLTEEVTIDLFHRLQKVPSAAALGSELGARAALIAAVLAHVREDRASQTVASAAGETKSGDQHVLHPLRLRWLFATRSLPDCLITFRRLVALLGKEVNVADLAESLFDWPDEGRGDRRRTRWAFDYYGAESAAPSDDQAQAIA